MRYNDKLKSLKCGRIVPPSRWDGPDRLPIEVRSQHNKTYELFLSLRTMKSLQFWSVVRKVPVWSCDIVIIEHHALSFVKTKSRQRVWEHRISRHRLRKCLGSSGHSSGVMPLSLYGTYCWGHSPALTNQNYILKWRHKYVSVGWWYLGHHTWFGVRAYLQAGPDLQGCADFNGGLALTWSLLDCDQSRQYHRWYRASGLWI